MDILECSRRVSCGRHERVEGGRTMIEAERIIVMSQLAKLKKQGLDESVKITQYYIEDYVYIKNFVTRIGILCILGGWAVADIMAKAQEKLVIPTTLQEVISSYILPYGSVTLLVLVVYTMLSTRVYTKRYYAAQEQVAVYNYLMQQLERLDDKEDRGGRDGKRKSSNS